jgi:hypothetical protein
MESVQRLFAHTNGTLAPIAALVSRKEKPLLVLKKGVGKLFTSKSKAVAGDVVPARSPVAVNTCASGCTSKVVLSLTMAEVGGSGKLPKPSLKEMEPIIGTAFAALAVSTRLTLDASGRNRNLFISPPLKLINNSLL